MAVRVPRRDPVTRPRSCTVRATRAARTRGPPVSTTPTAGASRSCATRPATHVWVSPVSPGTTHDITAARAFALPVLYCAAAAGIPTLTAKGYQGPGIGIRPRPTAPEPARRRPLRDNLLTSLRAVAERGNALIKNTWHAP